MNYEYLIVDEFNAHLRVTNNEEVMLEYAMGKKGKQYSVFNLDTLLRVGGTVNHQKIIEVV